MTFTSSAPARKTAPGVQEDASTRVFPISPGEPPSSRSKANHARLLWEHRRLFLKVAIYAAIASAILAFLIPSRFRATAQLMPPDGQQGLGMALVSALSTKGSSGLGALAGDLLGSKNSGALFVGVLKSRTVADRLINEFQLWRVYRERKME